MTDWVYEYEDHTYPTQERAYNVLKSVTELPVCRPGKHDWQNLTPDGYGELCLKCLLIRWKEVSPRT